MKIKIKNLVDNEITYRGTLHDVVFDAAAGEWTGTAMWRSSEAVQKVDVSGADLNALVTAAIEVVVPAV